MSDLTKAKPIQDQGYTSCKKLLHCAGCQVSTHPCITQGWEVRRLEFIFQADYEQSLKCVKRFGEH